MSRTLLFFSFFGTILIIGLTLAASSSAAAADLIKLPSSWAILSPFLYGKTEVDGDPLSAFGGLSHLYKQRQQKNLKIPSEAVPGGTVSWRTAKMRFLNEMGTYGELNVDHRELMELKQQMQGDNAVMEFVGFAVGEIDVPRGQKGGDSFVFEVYGINTIYIKDEVQSGDVWVPHSADQYGRGVYTTVRFSKPGKHLIAVRLRGVGGAHFRIRSVRNVGFSVRKYDWLSDLVCDKTAAGGICEFYLGNEHTSIAAVVQSHSSSYGRDDEAHPVTFTIDGGSSVAKFLAIDNKKPSSSSSLCDEELIGENPVARDMLCNNEARNGEGEEDTVAPGTSRIISRSIRVTDPQRAFEACGGQKPKLHNELIVPVYVSVGGGSSSSSKTKLQFSMRCRDIRHDTFVVSYRDFDGSPAHAGVVLPLERVNVTAEETASGAPASFPIMATLHGTGVAATSQVDSHKTAPNVPGNFVFGARGVFIIAPSRAGAHNHEFAGARSNFFSLLFISAVLRQRSRSRTSSSSSSASSSPLLSVLVPDLTHGLICSGHSMGSRGSLVLATQLATNYTIGVLLLGVWIRKHDYGDSNSQFSRYDRSSDSMLARRRGIIEASVADQDLLLENIATVPIFLRTGASDTTTAPFWARRLTRLLREAGAKNVTYSEPRKTLDGAATHWWWSTRKRDDGGVIFDGFVRKAIAKILAAAKINHGEDQGTRTAFASYSPYTAAVGPRSGGGNIRLVEQFVPTEKSKLTLMGDVVESAENVKRVAINGKEFCFNEERSEFESCPAVRSLLRKPFGPIRQYSEAPFFVAAIVVAGGSQQQQQQSTLLWTTARYFADTHLVAYDTDAPLLTVDPSSSSSSTRSKLFSKLQSRRGLIVASLEATPNLQADLLDDTLLLGAPKIVVTSSFVSFAGRKIHGSNLTVVSVFAASAGAAAAGSRGGVVVVSQTIASLSHVSNFVAAPVPPPMVRSAFGNLLPDFFVVDADRAHEGYGAFVAAGFFDDAMEVSSPMSYFPLAKMISGGRGGDGGRSHEKNSDL